MDPVLSTAFKAARRAGQTMTHVSGNLEAVKIDSEAFNDFVSNAGCGSGMILVDALKEVYPHHKITCKESGSRGKSDTEYEWIIDPLDDTANLPYGHPQYAVPMALLHRGVLQEALAYAPEYNDLCVASCGQGALPNDRRVRVPNHVELNRCLVGTDFPVVDQSVMDKYLVILEDFLSETAGGRREGPVTLDLCLVVAGRLDGFLEFNLKPQDVAAGALIVEEAGGIVTDMQGNDTWLQTGNAVVGNPEVLAQVLQIVSAHN